MRTVHKYHLDIIDSPQRVMVPGGGTIVHVAAQNGFPTLWIEVYTSSAEEPRWFSVEGTGHPLSPGSRWVGTALAHGGTFVWHVYEDDSGGAGAA